MSLFARYNETVPEQPKLDAACGLRIRSAEEPDLPAIAAIEAEREGDQPERRLHRAEQFLRKSRETGQSSIFVAELNGEVVGFGKCDFFVPPKPSPRGVAPEGWYLAGLIVAPKFRRRSVGLQLTRARLQWLAQRTDRAYFFANAQNRVSIELHRRVGFLELTRDFFHPGATFAGGKGILFVAKLK